MREVVGHDQAKKRLMNNLSVQTWLICGKRGIGKATLIKSFSNWFLIKNCNEIALDLCVVENNVIGIEKIRKMKDFLYLSPIQSEYKIAIIDSLESMTNNAKNAILKILEEPPKNSKIFIISHKPHDIQTIIKCRCFQLNLSSLTYYETRQVVLSKCNKSNNQILNEIIALFPGMPGVIINAINNNTCEVYKRFYTFLCNLHNPEAIYKAINSEIELEVASYIIQIYVLDKIKKGIDGVEILLNKWKKLDELFIAAKQFHLDKKHVLASAINIVASSALNCNTL
ncbi:MAG: DNA polymerase III subunit delta' [Wolbachia endosymbiont of Meromenopon meropis]|nr:DNA polymerase III subunit delta' [Wolbachia endosymbiont of Meromenopon meropis]